MSKAKYPEIVHLCINFRSQFHPDLRPMLMFKYIFDKFKNEKNVQKALKNYLTIEPYRSEYNRHAPETGTITYFCEIDKKYKSSYHYLPF